MTPRGGSGRADAGHLTIRLCVMMLLQFLAFGSWFQTLGLVMATFGMASSIGLAYSSASIGAFVAPLLVGSLADRWFRSERVLAAVHLACAGLMIVLRQSVLAGSEGWTLALVFVYMAFYMPTMGITNSIIFRHMGEGDRRFPYVRVFGTIGFVVAGVVVGQSGLSASPGVFLVSAAVSAAMVVYSLTLPPTPPAGKGGKFSFADLVGAKAFVLFRQANFRVFATCVLLAGVPLALYTAYASAYIDALGVKNVATVLAIGPVSEIVFVVTIPWLLRTVGMRWALLVGLASWAVRLPLLALAAGTGTTPLIIAIAMHGVCNDFLLVLGAMYVSSLCPPEISAQGQSLFTMLYSGLGALIGSVFGNVVFNSAVAPRLASDGAGAWVPLWTIGACTAGVAAVLWVAGYRRRSGGTTARTVEPAGTAATATTVSEA
ncbi:MFS transporter [Cellulomonas sp.]|uniref:MFS transporter n=1 Tax=Cellulomonas sp. TaxID=40001 RepID=UPI001B041451|nr:MFS transporter [Cellulomonas sp.]MBO9556815.1 MFS transporter [Cellulomonas sp.]